MDGRTHLVTAFMVGIAAGAVGPWALGGKDRPATEVFEYLPPPGFTPWDVGAGVVQRSVVGGQRAWIGPGESRAAPNISLAHVPTSSPETPEAVDLLATQIPQRYESLGLTWSEERHAVHLRPDGGKVAFIEGTTRPKDGTGQALRVLQMSFPEASGMSLVTASFLDADAGRWEGPVIASIDTARGVPVHAPPTAGWLYAAWGFGGALLAWIGLTLASRGSRGRMLAQSS
jgi:hypothetical protein